MSKWRLIARAADGSMRDGLSLLDQAIVYGNDVVGTETVSQMLGTVAQQPVEDLLRSLADNNAQEALNTIREMAQLSPNFADILQQILQVLHRLALIQLVPSSAENEDDAEMLRTLSPLFSAEELQLYYQIALMGQKDLSLSPDPRTGFEMIMLRMLAFNPQHSVAKQRNGVAPAMVQKPGPGLVQSKIAEPNAVGSAIAETESVATAGVVAQSIEPGTALPWHDMVIAMNLQGLTRELANNCVLEAVDDRECRLILDPKQSQIRRPRTEEKLQTAVQKYYAKPLKLVIKTEMVASDTPAVKIQKDKLNRQQEAVNAIDNDENIQALKTNFDARVIPGSIEPVENNND